jgi:hypothetical protein
MLLSLLDCFVPEHEAVFASSEFFTGKRFYDLCLEDEARTPEELEKKLGPEYKITVLTPGFKPKSFIQGTRRF